MYAIIVKSVDDHLLDGEPVNDDIVFENDCLIVVRICQPFPKLEMAGIASDLRGRQRATEAPGRDTVIVPQRFRYAGVCRKEGPIEFGAVSHLRETLTTIN